MTWLPAHTLDPGDDAAFLAIVERVVDGLVEKLEPRDVCVVRINNWFDDRWFRFAGKALGALGICTSDMNVPPFVPNRVESELAFVRNDGGYALNDSFRRLHVDIRSEDNLRRKVTDFSADGLFVWYSSASKTNSRGSLMIYYTGNNGSFDWYIGLKKADRWQLNIQHGLGREHAESLVAQGGDS